MTAEERILEQVEETIAKGPYDADWESLSAVKTPSWFDERRLGIFTHWGLYSVPAYDNEWYSRNMYMEDSKAFEHHVKTYGPQKDFGYKDFIPLFKAEYFDPEEWIRLFEDAGAGYICPVAEHHDGFQMYKSSLSRYNAAEMGPKRDVIGDLKSAAERAGLVFGTSSHRAEHWFFMGNGRKFDSDIGDDLHKGDFYWPAMPDVNFEDLHSTPAPTQEYLNDWLARTAELVLNYRPSLLYFDWWIQHEAFKPYLKKIAAFYYNCGEAWGRQHVICYKHDAFAFGTALVDMERGGFAAPKPFRWQTDTAAARNSWCHTDALEYKPGREVIGNLIDAVSKNGNLLLNIGPCADGTIAEGDRRILKELGDWMKVNREAINGSRPWRKSCEGPTQITEGQFQDGSETAYTPEDYRFTVRGDSLYAICMKCPEDGHFAVKSLRDSDDPTKRECHLLIDTVDILGYEGRAEWSVDEEALHVHAPGLSSEYPVTIRVRMR